MKHHIIIALFALAVNLSAQSDTSMPEYYIGYERGLSFRMFMPRQIGIGLIIQPTGMQMLYGDYENEMKSIDDDIKYESIRKIKEKGARALLDFQYRKRIGKIFSISPFLSVGGQYSTSHYTYRNTYTSADYSIQDYSNTSESDEKTLSFISQIGLMPGFEYGPISIQYRLGICGRISRTDSPENAKRSSSGGIKSLEVLYPADIVKSVMIHIGLKKRRQ